jgi:membrane protein
MASLHSLDRRQTNSAGRAAERPLDVDMAGWRDVFWRLWGRLAEDRVLVIAGGIVFYGLLALFPAMAALVSIYGIFANPADLNNQLTSLSSVLPGGAIDVISEQMSRIASQSAGALGFATLLGLIVALWSANGGTKAVYDGLNVAYREREKRSIVQLNISSLVFTIAIIVFAIVALSGMVVLPYIVNSFGFGQIGGWLGSELINSCGLTIRS